MAPAGKRRLAAAGVVWQAVMLRLQPRMNEVAMGSRYCS